MPGGLGLSWCVRATARAAAATVTLVRSRDASLTYPPGVAANDTVVVKVVSGEPEAEIVCGLLRSAGVECSYRDTEALDSLLEDFVASGPREILIHKSDLEGARALLADAER